jgi:L-threonylcarbamoyladenylate synthase
MTYIVKQIDKVVEALKRGEVVALPTETVYGLAACVNDDRALLKIFELKQRPQDNPLIVHCLDLNMIKQMAYVTDDFLKLYTHFMPGPLTVLLEKKNVSDVVTRGQPTVAIRVPSHPLFLDVLRHLGIPLAAPSANLSGRPSSTTAQHVFNDFSPKLTYILDGGASTVGLESTIVRLYDDYAVILRPGAITKEKLEDVLKKPVVFASKDAPLQAPGMKYRHYAPFAKVLLVDDITIDSCENETLYMSKERMQVKNWEMLSEDNLYKAFRLADEMGLKKIVILNRIEKAAGI